MRQCSLDKLLSAFIASLRKVLLGIFSFICLFSSVANAESKVVAATEIISPKNLSDYYDYLISPLLILIKDQKIVLPIAMSRDVDFKLSDSNQEISQKNVLNFSLDDKSQLVGNNLDQLNYGLPFGLAQEVNQEPSAKNKAAKIIWNLFYAQNLLQDTLYQLNFIWFGSTEVFKTASAMYYRKNYFLNIPSTEEFEKKELSNKLLTEFLYFRSPEIINQYSFNTQRYFSGQNDSFKIYSPLINKSRLLPINSRDDALLSCTLSLSDILNYNPDSLANDVIVVDEKKLLLPFNTTEKYKLEKLNSPKEQEIKLQTEHQKQELPRAKENSELKYLGVIGDKKNSKGGQSFNLFNYQSNDYPQLAPWAISNLVYLQRKVWVVEITKSNPYSNRGKEIIYIDQESFLPFYKIIYNHFNEVTNLLITPWSLAETSDKKLQIFFNTVNLSIDTQKQIACATQTELVQTFLGQENSRTKELEKLMSN